MDPHLPIFAVTTLDERLAKSWRTERQTAMLWGAFGGVALLLALVGLAGALGQTVTRRTRELGVRIACGASPKMVRGDVIAG